MSKKKLCIPKPTLKILFSFDSLHINIHWILYKASNYFSNLQGENSCHVFTSEQTLFLRLSVNIP